MLDEATSIDVHALARELHELHQRVDVLEHARKREPRDEMLSTLQAAGLTGRSRQCVVNWIERYAIGRFDPKRARWTISCAKLIAFCRAHPGASRHVFW
jgi:hypothetical protein